MKKKILTTIFMCIAFIMSGCEDKAARIYSIGETIVTMDYYVTLVSADTSVVDNKYEVVVTLEVTNIETVHPFDPELFYIKDVIDIYYYNQEASYALNGQEFDGNFFSSVKLVYSGIDINSELKLSIVTDGVSFNL